MIYKELCGEKLSTLGMGCMRFPMLDPETKKVDLKATEEMIDYAISEGVNYFDTAWVYHGGESESIIGKILSKYPRDSYYLATKFPGFADDYFTKIEEIFETQLKRCGVDYFDFYLFHNVSEFNIENYLNPEIDLFGYLLKQKKAGRIKHLGFSAHGKLPTIKRFLDAFGDELEFCQLQINYVDWTYQDAKAKLELLREYGIPVWIMEPLRGGKLAVLSEKYEKELVELRPDEKTPAWAFRFLQSLDGIGVILSGMSNFTQVKENINTFKTEKPLNDAEFAKLQEIASKLVNSIPCTACNYCTEYCPNSIDIPSIIKIYNKHVFEDRSKIKPAVLDGIDEGKRPTDCLACGACEAVCPQKIKISDIMKDFSEKLDKEA